MSEQKLSGVYEQLRLAISGVEKVEMFSVNFACEIFTELSIEGCEILPDLTWVDNKGFINTEFVLKKGAWKEWQFKMVFFEDLVVVDSLRRASTTSSWSERTEVFNKPKIKSLLKEISSAI